MKHDILLLHGALGNHAQFEPLKRSFSYRFNVHGFNFTGHNGLPATRAFSMDLFVEDVIHFLNEAGLDKMHVFGYSMGGYVAFKTALMHPERITKIMTLGTKLEWTEAFALKQKKMLNPEKIAEKVPQFADSLEKMYTTEHWPEVVRKTGDMMTALSQGAALMKAEWESINHSTQLMVGTLDQMVSENETAYVCDLLPNASMVMIDGFEHAIQKVDSDILAEIITGFINS